MGDEVILRRTSFDSLSPAYLLFQHYVMLWLDRINGGLRS